MKRIFPLGWLLGLGLALLPALGLASTATPLPKVDDIVKRALERGEAEPENDELFKQRYYFVRSRHTEIRNSDGDVKKLKIRISTNQPVSLALTSAAPVQPQPVPTIHAPKQAAADKNKSELPRKFEKKEHLEFGKELIKRYDFKLVGREVTNGCSLLVVDFTPKPGKLPENDLRDKVVNRMAGRLWIDEREYAIKRCAVRLIRNLKIIGGIVGEAYKFNFMFERERTDDGLWYVSESNWHVEGRQVVVYREADYHEKRTDVRKHVSPESSGWVQVESADEADKYWEELKKDSPPSD